MKLLKVALLALLLVGVASSERESFEWDNVTWSFEINQSHIIDDIIRTYYGHASPFKESSSIDLRDLIGDVESLSGLFYLEKDSCGYRAISEETFRDENYGGGGFRAGFSSDMNLTDFIDFLKSVKIEQISP